MSIQEQLQSDLKTALRAGDRGRLSAIRMCLSAIKNAQIDKGAPLDDAEAAKVLQKEAKTRRETILEFAKANRPDEVTRQEAELAVVESYLPRQLSREELVPIAQRVIDEVGATGPRDLGKVMPRLLAQVQGRAEGRLVNQVVQELLSNR